MENKFCKFCGGEVKEYHSVCHHCGRQINLVPEKKEVNHNYDNNSYDNNDSSNSKEFYKSDWFMWLTLIFFPPVGIYLMFQFNKKLSNPLKIILSLFFGTIFLTGVVNGMTSDSIENNNSSENIAVVESNKKNVAVIDFSAMALADIEAWGTQNNIKLDIQNSYSNEIPKNSFISQSVAANEEIQEGKKIIIIYSLGAEPTVSQKNAVKKAESYIDYSAFSRTGLIKQLEFEGFSKEDATYGVDNITVDWNEQVVKKAESYLEYQAFSKSGLISQLKFEGFTNEQAAYGASQVGL